MISTASNSPSRWPFRAALAVAVVTFPLIWAGGLVTTTKAGMAVPDWPNTFGYNPLLYPWLTWFFGPWDLFIEHGHRLLGMLVGLLSIGLVFVTWKYDLRKWVRISSLGLLAAIVAQGILGGMRVELSDQQLAMIHGTTGPLVFAGAVALVAVMTRRWHNALAGGAPQTSRRVAMIAATTLVLTYMQIGAGAWLRHMPVTANPRTFTMATMLHLTLALLIVCHVTLVTVWAWRDRAPVRRLATIASGLIVLQISLGLATWAARYAIPHSLSTVVASSNEPIVANGFWQTNIVTAHQATGSLLLVTLALTTIFSCRTCPAPRQSKSMVSPRLLKGATA